MQSPVIDLEAEKAAAQTLRERARTVPCAYCGSMMAYGHRDLHPTKMRIKQLINGRGLGLEVLHLVLHPVQGRGQGGDGEELPGGHAPPVYDRSPPVRLL